MPNSEPFKQFSFRLPKPLVSRVEQCLRELRGRGLEVTRADVVRLLLTHALNATKCRIDLLFNGNGAPRRRRA